MTEIAAIKLERDGKDIASIVLESVSAAAELKGRPLEWADIGEGIAPLLAAAYSLATACAIGANFNAHAEFAALLRRFADNVEREGGADARGS